MIDSSLFECVLCCMFVFILVHVLQMHTLQYRALLTLPEDVQ